MAEDLDSLLADLELTDTKPAPAKKAQRDASDLDDLLADVLGEGKPAPAPERPRAGPRDQPAPPQPTPAARSTVYRQEDAGYPAVYRAKPTGSHERCETVFLSTGARGRSSGFKQLVCDRLKCTACDFEVIFFNDMSWKEECDVLFFRNHFPVDRARPDTTKLERGLKPQTGALAACCQCAFRTVTEAAVPLTKTGSTVPSWRCGGH